MDDFRFFFTPSLLLLLFPFLPLSSLPSSLLFSLSPFLMSQSLFIKPAKRPLSSDMNVYGAIWMYIRVKRYD